MNQYTIELETAQKVAIGAGDLLLDLYQKDQHVVRKSMRELVSEGDLGSEKFLIEQLQQTFLNDSIVSEERQSLETSSDRVWIVDPLDGSHNFIAGLPFWSVSIGFMVDRNIILGVIFFPLENEMFYAVNGQGAFCNGTIIGVSDNLELSKSVVMYDNQFHLDKQSFERYEAITNAAFTTRIFGTATKDLCLIASGTVDARIWNRTKLVDLAAGSVILRESGGEITDFDGNDPGLDFQQVVASNGRIHKEILQELNTINNTE
mgnify:CR=1 FL=1